MEIHTEDIFNFIRSHVHCRLEGERNFSISSVHAISSLTNGSLTWLKPGRKINGIGGKKNILVVCNESAFEEIKHEKETGFIITSEPRYVFSKIANHYFNRDVTGIHATADIHPEAVIGKNCFIGPFTYIGKCIIGDNVFIKGNCHLYDGVSIGQNVRIHAGVVIGSDGFGYTRSGDEIEKFPHFGGVVIGDDVEIGANTCIDRGALEDTVIGNKVKIDNLVHIAHNVVIEENSFIIAHAMIGGSTHIGKNCWIAPAASLLQQLVIGNDVTVGMGSVVLENIPSNEVWAGIPAKKLNNKQL